MIYLPGPARRLAASLPCLRFAAALAGLGVVLAACEPRSAAAPTAAPASADAAPPPEVWTAVLTRTRENRKPTPETFVTASGSLRVITTLHDLVSPLRPGLLVTNLLSDATALPIASIHVEQLRLSGATVDTTAVEVPPGRIHFFVAEQRGLQGWEVRIEELAPAAPARRRTASSDAPPGPPRQGPRREPG
jgi:hypothetical protein